MCGVFGTFGQTDDATTLLHKGMYQLQHRGQETAGAAVTDGKRITVVSGPGYVSDIISASVLKETRGFAGIGHTRYSTAGGKRRDNAQPMHIDCQHGEIAIAHNGNLTNEKSLKNVLINDGAIFRSTSDTEVILHLYARAASSNPAEAIIEALNQVKGAYSLLFLTKDSLIAARDPYGFRPLSLGRLENTWFVASETVAFDIHQAEFVRDIEPGEILVINHDELKSYRINKQEHQTLNCVFEHVYFSRPDSVVYGQSVEHAREQMGMILAIEQPCQADIVVPVLDSGLFAAQGYSIQSGLPLKFGLIRNHYVGRSFIQPQQSERESSVKFKLNPAKRIIEGNRVVLVDDSLIRGTTSRKIIRMIRSAGATEVHLRISGPPTKSACFYGIDTPRSEDLIAFNKSVEEIRQFIEADSLAYLSLDGLKKAVNDNNNHCFACYTGHYPLQDERQFVTVERRHRLNP